MLYLYIVASHMGLGIHLAPTNIAQVTQKYCRPCGDYPASRTVILEGGDRNDLEIIWEQLRYEIQVLDPPSADLVS